MRGLVPPGKDPPPSLGGHSTGEASDQRIKRPERLQMLSASTLMRCCCTMLTSPYPVQVLLCNYFQFVLGNATLRVVFLEIQFFCLIRLEFLFALY